MRRAALAVIAITLATSSAAGACRKHAIWKYPWPQPCYTAYAPQPLQHRAEEQDRDWSVEITKLPPTWNLDEHIEVTVPEDPDRARGLNKLKEQLK
jgi:hypothetical protein